MSEVYVHQDEKETTKKAPYLPSKSYLRGLLSKVPFSSRLRSPPGVGKDIPALTAACSDPVKKEQIEIAQSAGVRKLAHLIIYQTTSKLKLTIANDAAFRKEGNRVRLSPRCNTKLPVCRLCRCNTQAKTPFCMLQKGFHSPK